MMKRGLLDVSKHVCQYLQSCEFYGTILSSPLSVGLGIT